MWPSLITTTRMLSSTPAAASVQAQREADEHTHAFRASTIVIAIKAATHTAEPHISPNRCWPNGVLVSASSVPNAARPSGQAATCRRLSPASERLRRTAKASAARLGDSKANMLRTLAPVRSGRAGQGHGDKRNGHEQRAQGGDRRTVNAVKHDVWLLGDVCWRSVVCLPP